MSNTMICGAGTTLNYSLINAYTLEFYTNSTCNIDYNNKYIQSITCGNTKISINDEFNHGNQFIPSKYKIINIQEGSRFGNKCKYRFTAFTHFRNLTTSYILPCLGKDENYFLGKTNLINAYIDKKIEHIYLLYRYSQDSHYYEYLEPNITGHSMYVGNVTSKENLAGFDVFKFKISKEYLSDVRIFMEGKYSRIGEDLKQQIIRFYKLDKKSHIFKVLYRDKELQNKLEKLYACSFDGIDLEDKPKKENEIWD